MEIINLLQNKNFRLLLGGKPAEQNHMLVLHNGVILIYTAVSEIRIKHCLKFREWK